MSAAIISLSCGRGALTSDTPPVGSSEGGRSSALSATLFPGHASFSTSARARIFAKITNTGDEKIEINLWNLGQSQLALEIRNERNERMLTIGPSTPQRPEVMARYLKSLAPRQTETIEYNLNIFSPPLDAGTYSVKMFSIPSNTARFSIRPWMFWK